MTNKTKASAWSLHSLDVFASHLGPGSHHLSHLMPAVMIPCWGREAQLRIPCTFFFFKIFLNHCSQYPMLKYLGNYAVVGKRCLMTHCAQPSRAVCFWGDAFSEQPIVYFISTVVLARMVAILPTSAVNDRTIGSSHTHTHRHIYMLLYFLPCVYSMSFVFFIINPCSNETALSFRVKQNGL